jgi:hypothetical protein
MRDHSTHTANVGRAYHLGGESDGDVWLRNPKTGEHVERHFIDEFQIWVSNMRQLVESLRATATASMNSKTSLDQTSVE